MPKERQTTNFTIRLTEAERISWRQKANLSGLSISKLIRSSVENLTVTSNEDRQAVKDLRNEINRIGVNLNQVARWANTYKSEAEAEEILDSLKAIAEYCQRLAHAN